MTIARSLAPRSLLFLPASNPRAIEKARGLAADMIFLDLEDAVKPADKATARTAAVAAAADGFGGRPVAIRVNMLGTEWHDADVAAVAASRADYVILPKAEVPDDVATVAARATKPLLAMIETPCGVLAAPQIASIPDVAGLIAGTNDLRATLKLPPDAPRASLALSLQMVVLAARYGDCWAFDGVYNRLDDGEGFADEAREGRALGFDGKTLIHPSQVDPCNALFGPTEAEIADARALIAAATGGAERFGDRMIEAMHVDQARGVLARVGGK
ncbi:CoA ester lyase [Sphingomonas donggukensis]|uniref:CoA ester lyase n=1 Tax=Sphingomonas donggukensis TaxID=2949093 RepID=A0ABY4TVS7_9SPHN|nr:CoA ester lyase [Sphingomonas donggukensis]URW76487.1 CoA ester lyase [Sphingomonas donggukensis]